MFHIYSIQRHVMRITANRMKTDATGSDESIDDINHIYLEFPLDRYIDNP